MFLSIERAERPSGSVPLVVPRPGPALVALATAATRRSTTLTRRRPGRREFLLHRRALVVADAQALLEQRDRVGRVAGRAEAGGEVEEGEGVGQLVRAALGAEAGDGLLQDRHGAGRVALLQELEALVVEAGGVAGRRGRGAGRRRGRRRRGALGLGRGRGRPPGRARG